MLPPVGQVSVMTSSKVVSKTQNSRAITIPVAPVVDRSGSERLALLKTIAEIADPMQSETVKGWFLGELHPPR